MFGLGRIRNRYYKWCESVKFLSRNKGMRAGKNLDLRLSQYIHCAGSVVLGDIVVSIAGMLRTVSPSIVNLKFALENEYM